MLKAMTALVLILALSPQAQAAEALDFFQVAIQTFDPEAQAIQIEPNHDPLVAFVNGLYYVDLVAQRTTDRERIAYSFYRVTFIDAAGVKQDCLGGLGFEPGFGADKRWVDIESCNENFFQSTTRYLDLIDLAQ